MGVFDGYKLHHLKLANREFSYYIEDDRGQMMLQGLLLFDLYSVEIELDMKENPGFWLRILNSDHEFYFRSDRETLTEKKKHLQLWINQISLHI
jgi:hypothetical protein